MFILSGSPVEFFLMLALGAGGHFTDVASLIHPDSYFRTRKIDITIGKMLELAAAEPKNSTAELQQLLAIRLLAADPAEVRNDKAVLQVLRALAAGKKGNDRLGFTKQYAAWALARLTAAKPLSFTPMPATSLSADAFAWFPADITWAAAVDLRPTAQVPPHDFAHLKTMFDRLLRFARAEDLYDFAEKVGNCRLDRMTFAVSLGKKKQGPPERIYLRLTGLADHQRLVAYLKEYNPGIKVEERHKPGKEPITVLSHAKKSPAFLVVGDREFIIAGPSGDQGNPIVVIDEILDVRAGLKKSMVSGPLATRLQKVGPDCFALVIGDLPSDFASGLLGGLGELKLDHFPKSAQLELLRSDKGVQLKLAGTMADAAAAKLSQQITEAAESSLGNLKYLKNVVSEEVIDQFKKMLLTTRMEADGTTVRGGLFLPTAVLRVLPRFLPEHFDDPPPVKKTKE